MTYDKGRKHSPTNTPGNRDSEGLSNGPTLRPPPWRAGRGQTGDGWGRDGGNHLVPKNEAGQR